jgi:tetratricopeptide (TPR) repeat protein
LGNYWYSVRNYTEAIACWEKSASLDDSFPTVHRNLSLAYHNKQHNTKQALHSLEKSFELDNTDGRILMELDQLYKLNNKPYKERLQLLEEHIELVEDRDDLYLERITLYNQLGKYAEAKALMEKRKFHPWEGGEGKTVGQFLITHIGLAKTALLETRFDDALQLLNSTASYPHNLGEGKLYGTQENDIHYLQGCAYEGMGLAEEAKKNFELATIGVSEPVQAIFYNDPQPDKIFYQGLAWLKLGNENKAQNIFHRFISFGQEHMNDEITIDYFAVSLPDLLVFDQDLNIKNTIHCKYLIGIGYLGLENYATAEHYFDEVLTLNLNHQGAQEHKNMIGFLKQSHPKMAVD